MLDDLLGYLLGALNGEEHQEVAVRLQADVEALRQLESLRRLLAPFEACREHAESPPGLAARTCVQIRTAIDAAE